MSAAREAGPREPDTAPAGYVEARSPGGSWLARPECADEIREGRIDFLLAGAGARAPRGGAGRSRLAWFALAGREAVGKRALHGGLLGPLLGGLYLGPGRGLLQLEAALRLERQGVPTPEVLAVGWRARWGILRAIAVVTRAIPRAQNLYEAACEESPWRRRRAILMRSADVVRAMHDAGFRHADLNVSNLLLGGGPEGDRVYVVDLDKGRFLESLGEEARFANLARLLRSYEKWVASRAPLSARDEIAFLRRYCLSDRARFRTLQARLHRSRSRLGLRRLAWRLRAALVSSAAVRRPE